MTSSNAIVGAVSVSSAAVLDSSVSSTADESSAVGSSSDLLLSSVFAAVVVVTALSALPSALLSSELPQAAIDAHILSESTNARIDLIFFM